ncbi:MAG: TolC family protein [bacterium]
MRTILAVLGIICFSSTLLAADIPSELTLPEAIKIALAQNLELQGVKQDKFIAIAKKEQAESLRFPKLELDASYTKLPEPPFMQVPTVELTIPGLGSLSVDLPKLYLAEEDSKRATLTGSMPLYTSGRISNAIKSAELGVNANTELISAKQNDISLQVTQAYLVTVLAQHVEQVNLQALSVIREHLKNAEALFKAGIVANYDVLRAKTELAAQEKRLTDAQNQQNLARSVLFNILNVPLNTETKLITPFAAVDSSFSCDTESQTAVLQSRELAALRLKSQAQLALSKSAAAADKPQFFVAGLLETYTDELSVIDPHEAMVVGMKLNLFDGGATRAVARELQESSRRTLIDADRLEKGIRLQVKQAVFEFESGKKGLAFAQQAVSSAEESLRLATRRFETGTGTSVEKLDAILSLSQAQMQQEQALYQMNLAYYTVLKLQNKLIPYFQSTEVK